MSYSGFLFALVFSMHIALVSLGAWLWIRFTRRDLRRNEIRFQYNIADVYAGIFGLLPWLWLLAEFLRAKDAAEIEGEPDGEPASAGFTVWILAMFLFTLAAGWYLGVQNRLLADRRNRETFVLAVLATLLYQYLVVAVFVMLSIIYLAVVTVLIEAFRL
ncbi:MAG: hypothetical protein L6R28_08710 [Planctomycetes bacterium]|nr:hypothetical protein [Planctomycetota bacterium]